MQREGGRQQYLERQEEGNVGNKGHPIRTMQLHGEATHGGMNHWEQLNRVEEANKAHNKARQIVPLKRWNTVATGCPFVLG